MRVRELLFGAVVALCFSALPARAEPADPALLAAIMQLPAIDNHAHPQGLPGADGRPDMAFNALACEQLDFVQPPPMTLDNPAFLEAWRRLYGVNITAPVTPAVFDQIVTAKERVRAAHGAAYPAWVLSQMGIETMLTNRRAPGPGLDAPHFRWVSYGDPLLNPFDTTALRISPDRAVFYPQQEGYFQEELAASGLTRLPGTLQDYLAQVVTPTLERQRRGGAIAIKFVAAYLRSLDFADVREEDAARIYARYRRGGAPTADEYKTFQDYVFRHIAREAGRLGMPVHIHTGGGCGRYFYMAGGNPMLLEPAINDPSLRNTNFVLIHGGWPWPKEV